MDETIDEAGEGFEFLKSAYRDALMQISMEFELLQGIQAAGHIGLAFPDAMPENAGIAGIVGDMKRYLSQAAVIRHPVSVSADKVGEAISFGESAKSLGSKRPTTLIESVYDSGGGMEAFVFFPNLAGDDGAANFLLPRLTEAGMAVRATGFALV